MRNYNVTFKLSSLYGSPTIIDDDIQAKDAEDAIKQIKRKWFSTDDENNSYVIEQVDEILEVKLV